MDWSKECQKTLDTIKKSVSRETLLSYLNFNKVFVIHMDASKLQLRAVIRQDGKSIYNRKVNSAQVNYTTNEWKLLSIVPYAEIGASIQQ